MDPYESYPCGRPLGMVFDTLGNNLIVAHSLLGIFEVNLETGEKKHLVKNDEVIGEKVSRFLIENLTDFQNSKPISTEYFRKIKIR